MTGLARLAEVGDYFLGGAFVLLHDFFGGRGGIEDEVGDADVDVGLDGLYAFVDGACCGCATMD